MTFSYCNHSYGFQGSHSKEHGICIIHLKTKISATCTLIKTRKLTANCFPIPGSDFKDPSLREEIPFVVKVSLHSDDLFLFRLGSEETLLLCRKQTKRSIIMLNRWIDNKRVIFLCRLFPHGRFRNKYITEGQS